MLNVKSNVSGQLEAQENVEAQKQTFIANTCLSSFDPAPAMVSAGPLQKAAFSNSPLATSDVCRRKHRGNPQSVAANQDTAGRKQRDSERILAFLRTNESTRAEIAECLGMPYQTVSARCADLKKAGFISGTGET